MTDMLSELGDIQQSGESPYMLSLSVGIETRDTTGKISRTYVFTRSSESSTWNFSEYMENKRDGDEWTEAQRISWDDPEGASVDVPPEVADELREVTNAEVVTLRVPNVSEDRYEPEDVYHAE